MKRDPDPRARPWRRVRSVRAATPRARPDPPRRGEIATKVADADLWQETEAGDVAVGSGEPASYRTAVGRELGPQNSAVFGQDPGVGPRRGNQHPDAHGLRLPAVVARKAPGDPSPNIHRGHERIDVDDPCLELDDEQRPSRGMPGEDVDDASFAIAGERDLREGQPSADGSEPLSSRLVHARVPAIQESVELVAAPEELPIEPSTKRARDLSDLAERHAVQAASFDRHDHASWDAGELSEVNLAKAAAETESPNGRPEPLVIHPGEHDRGRLCRDQPDSLPQVRVGRPWARNRYSAEDSGAVVGPAHARTDPRTAVETSDRRDVS